MKTLIKLIMLSLTAITLCLTLTGCGSKEENSTSDSLKDSKELIVKSVVNDVEIKEIDGENVTASLVGFEGELLTRKGDSLEIKLPEPKAGINLSPAEVLYIGIPKNSSLSIKVESEISAIKLDKLSVNHIEAVSDAGNITIIAPTGTLDAKTEAGKIHSSLSPKMDIQKQGDGEVTQGTIDNASSTVVLRSSTGDIELK